MPNFWNEDKFITDENGTKYLSAEDSHKLYNTYKKEIDFLKDYGLVYDGNPIALESAEKVIKFAELFKEEKLVSFWDSLDNEQKILLKTLKDSELEILEILHKRLTSFGEVNSISFLYSKEIISLMGKANKIVDANYIKKIGSLCNIIFPSFSFGENEKDEIDSRKAIGISIGNGSIKEYINNIDSIEKLLNALSIIASIRASVKDENNNILDYKFIEGWIRKNGYYSIEKTTDFVIFLEKLKSTPKKYYMGKELLEYYNKTYDLEHAIEGMKQGHSFAEYIKKEINIDTNDEALEDFRLYLGKDEFTTDKLFDFLIKTYSRESTYKQMCSYLDYIMKYYNQDETINFEKIHEDLKLYSILKFSKLDLRSAIERCSEPTRILDILRVWKTYNLNATNVEPKEICIAIDLFFRNNEYYSKENLEELYNFFINIMHNKLKYKFGEQIAQYFKDTSNVVENIVEISLGANISDIEHKIYVSQENEFAEPKNVSSDEIIENEDELENASLEENEEEDKIDIDDENKGGPTGGNIVSDGEEFESTSESSFEFEGANDVDEAPLIVKENHRQEPEIFHVESHAMPVEENGKKRAFCTMICGVSVISCAVLTAIHGQNVMSVAVSCAKSFGALISKSTLLEEIKNKLGNNLLPYFVQVGMTALGVVGAKKIFEDQPNDEVAIAKVI